MLLTLIRHSKTTPTAEIPIPRWGLNEQGIELAKALALTESIQAVDILYSSLQTKALETAVLLAKPNAMGIKTDDRLTEITSFTNQFEADLETYEKRAHQFYAGTLDRINQGETVAEALSRFNEALTDIVQWEADKQNIGIVSHGNILAYFCAQFMPVEMAVFHKTIRMPDVAIFDWEGKQFLKMFGQG
jgi:broad specificity phosphatase PhoE